MSSDDPHVEFSTGAKTPEQPGKREYSIVFVADFGVAEKLDRLTSVDKDEFAKVLSAASPTLPVAIANPLGGGGADWEFQLAFDALKAFEPAALLARTAGGRWRLGVREKLIARRRGGISPADIDSAINAAVAGDASLAWLRYDATTAAAPPTTATAPPAGDILDMVDEPDEMARVSAEVERLAASAGDADARVSGAEAALLDRRLARLDGELGKIAEALLKHPDVRRVESSWRSLKFLVDRIEFRDTGVRLSILNAPRAESVARFIERVVNPAFEGDIPTPGLVIFDYGFTNTPNDIEMLDELAQHAASLPVPVVTPLESEFFNVKSWRLLKNLPNLSGLTDGFQFAKWRSLRDQPYAKALIPVAGRFILRQPYAAKARSAEYTYAEVVAKVSDLAWAHGHLAMGVCAARAFAEHGWPTRMFGAEAGKLDDLPVVNNPNDPQDPWGPGDLLLPDRRADELPVVGVNFLMSVKNNDYCMLLGGVSAARPVETADVGKRQAALEISLPYQQFSNVVSDYLSEQLPSLRGLDPDKIQEKLLFGLAKLLGIKSQDELEAVQVGVGAHPDDPAQTIVQIRLTPPQRIVPGGLNMEFGFGV